MSLETRKSDLGDKFQQLFELIPALDEVTLDQVFRLRHDVYCRDLGWEPVRADGRESDEFDRHSFHCLLRSRDTGDAIGCTRLIVARPEAPLHPLPFEVSCADVIDRSLSDPVRLPRNTMGEVSRLAVAKAFRQRKGEATTVGSITDDDFSAHGANTRFPYIPVSLYLGAAAIAQRVGVEHVFVLTEPRLALHFVRIGFDIQTIGDSIEHRGLRVPSLLSSSRVVAGLRPMIQPLYAVVEAAVERAFQAHPDAAERVLKGG